MTPQFQLPKGTPDSGPRQVKVLSLSGGGYRGLFSAQLLARLEAALDAGAAPGLARPIGERFDLIVGTSIGGILACGLSLGSSAARLAQTLERHGPRIFPPLRLRALRKLVGKAPYDPRRLRRAIQECVGAQQAAAPLAEHPRPLLLTTVDWTSSRLHLLGSKGSGQADRLGLSLMDAMLATSAAPAHFPSHRVAGHLFVDGGLAANAPDLLALRAAQTLWPGAELRLLSVGTANPLAGRDPAKLPQRGLGWAAPTIELCMHAQELHAVEQCAALLGPTRYLRLNAHPSAAQVGQVDFDVATPTSTKILLSLADDLARQQLEPAQRARLMAML